MQCCKGSRINQVKRESMKASDAGEPKSSSGISNGERQQGSASGRYLLQPNKNKRTSWCESEDGTATVLGIDVNSRREDENDYCSTCVASSSLISLVCWLQESSRCKARKYHMLQYCLGNSSCPCKVSSTFWYIRGRIAYHNDETILERDHKRRRMALIQSQLLLRNQTGPPLVTDIKR